MLFLNPRVKRSNQRICLPTSTAFYITMDRTCFQCAVCLELPDGQIFQCRQGHLICSPCHQKWKASNPGNVLCPTCRVPLDDPPSRCRVAEAALATADLACTGKVHYIQLNVPLHEDTSFAHKLKRGINVFSQVANGDARGEARRRHCQVYEPRLWCRSAGYLVIYALHHHS